MDYNNNKAFTLIELLITLSIFSILSLAGVYYYQSHTAKTKLGLYINQFYVDLTYAKEQALIKQYPVSICPIDKHWENGYTLILNSDNNKTLASPLLTRTPPYPKSLSIQAHFGLNQPCVYFDTQGQSLFNGHIVYSIGNSGPFAKIILTQTGKMHLEIS